MVEIGRKVKILYTAQLEGGTVLDSSDHHGGDPMEFVIGGGQVMPGLDKAVRDMVPHEKRSVAVPATDAYGEYKESLVEAIPAADFPGVEDLPVGGYIMLSLPDKRVRAKVVSVEDGLVTLDFNHEHSGKTILFDIELVEVFGETGSAVENEQHAENCGCGCQKLKEQLSANEAV